MKLLKGSVDKRVRVSQGIQIAKGIIFLVVIFKLVFPALSVLAMAIDKGIPYTYVSLTKGIFHADLMEVRSIYTKLPGQMHPKNWVK